jgi:hypothetical protein
MLSVSSFAKRLRGCGLRQSSFALGRLKAFPRYEQYFVRNGTKQSSCQSLKRFRHTCEPYRQGSISWCSGSVVVLLKQVSRLENALSCALTADCVSHLSKKEGAEAFLNEAYQAFNDWQPDAAVPRRLRAPVFCMAVWRHRLHQKVYDRHALQRALFKELLRSLVVFANLGTYKMGIQPPLRLSILFHS